MSVMVMCIKEGMLTTNKSLKDRGKEPSFKLLYSTKLSKFVESIEYVLT